EVGPNGNLIAVGPPLVNPNPSLADPNPPLPPWMPPSPAVPGTANPALVPAPQPPVPLSPAAPVAPYPGGAPVPGTRPAPAAPPPGTGAAEAAPASYGGNVGPVGSQHELDQLGLITGQPATVATQLLLGPVARGTTVSTGEEPR
ncbi:mammalian cell entry protein, partial [Mycobacterium sp. ITM-2017-0098]